MSRLWGGRFAGETNPVFAAFNASLHFDRRLLDEDIEGSRAWARALGGAGVLTAGEVQRLADALGELAAELRADPSPLDGSDAEDVHSFVEAALTVKVGDLARKLHTGRSRNDQVATDLRLHLRRAGARLTGRIEALIAALAALARTHAATPIPGYTHLQKAQPVTVGHHALAYAEMLCRDRGRLTGALARMDQCPLGSGALAGTAFAVDREALAADLGFAGGPCRNSLDAVSDRDFACEIVFACALAMTHLSRLAEDWIFAASGEVRFLELGDAVSTGSSLMPQKKNPDALELIRGKTGRVAGALTALLAVLKGLPLAYDKDMQEDKEALFDALDTTDACLAVMTLCVETAAFDVARCTQAAATGHLNATDVADLLVRAGVPFRDAHERTGKAVRAALEAGCEIEDLPAATLHELLPELAGTDLREALSVRAVLDRRAALGGTAPARVSEAVQALEEEIATWPTRP